jgi:hypothetical protein
MRRDYWDEVDYIHEHVKEGAYDDDPEPPSWYWPHRDAYLRRKKEKPSNEPVDRTDT